MTHLEIVLYYFQNLIDLELLVYFYFFGLFIPSLLVMFICYTYIFLVVRRTKKAIRNLYASFLPSQKLDMHIKTHSRGDFSIFVCIIVFMLCWLPFHIRNCLELWTDTNLDETFKIDTSDIPLNTTVKEDNDSRPNL